MEEIANAELGLGDDLDGSKFQRGNSVFGPAMGHFRQTTTGIGLSAMIFRRKVRPSIRGITRSVMITSGTSFSIFANAMIGSAATLTLILDRHEHSLHDLPDHGRVIHYEHVNVFVRFP